MFGLPGIAMEFGVLGLICTIFSITMLINAIRRKFKEKNEKILWILAILFSNCIGAILYYFLVYKKDKKSDPKLIQTILIVAFGIMILSLLAILVIFLINRI